MKETSLKKEHLELAYRNNWFKIFVSKQFGGSELSLPYALSEYFKAASIDGSLGWCVNLGSGASIFSGYLPQNGSMSVFSDKRAVCAGSGGIGQYKETTEGYTVSGHWDKCTGADHATHFTVNAQNESGEVHSFVIERSDVMIHPDYYLDGLTRSSSLSISANEALVPFEHRFQIDRIDPKSSYLIHQLDFETFAKFCMIASVLGVAKCLVNSAKEDDQLYPERAKTIIDEFEQFIEISFQEVLQLSKEAWRELEKMQFVSEDLKERLSVIIPHTNKGVFDRANELLYAGGLRLKDVRTNVHRAYNDLMLATQHYMLK